MKSEKQPLRILTQYKDSVVNEQNSDEIFTDKNISLKNFMKGYSLHTCAQVHIHTHT